MAACKFGDRDANDGFLECRPYRDTNFEVNRVEVQVGTQVFFVIFWATQSKGHSHYFSKCISDFVVCLSKLDSQFQGSDPSIFPVNMNPS